MCLLRNIWSHGSSLKTFPHVDKKKKKVFGRHNVSLTTDLQVISAEFNFPETGLDIKHWCGIYTIHMQSNTHPETARAEKTNACVRLHDNTFSFFLREKVRWVIYKTAL